MLSIDCETALDSRGESVHLYAFGDVHVGSRHTSMKRFERDIEMIANDPKAHWIAMGDMTDSILTTDKRFDPEDIHPYFAQDGFQNLHRREMEYVIETLRPIADKGLAVLTGNHEETVKRKTATQGVLFDGHAILCDALQVPSLHYCGFVRWKFKSPHAADTVIVAAHHGFGSGRTAGGHANALHHALNSWDADLFLMGHRHQSLADPKVRIGIPHRGRLKINQRVMMAAHTGTYVKTYADGSAGYSERALYAPAVLGCRKFIITPRSQDEERIKLILP